MITLLTLGVLDTLNKSYKIKGDYHAIQGTSSVARTKELAEKYIRIFKEKVNPDAKCEIVEVEPSLFQTMVLY